MSENPQSHSGGDILKLLIEKINAPVFLFALAIIVALALFGAGIPAEFRVLIYGVVVGGLLIYAGPALAAVLRRPKPHVPSTIETGGGTQVGRDVNSGGDFIGRDQVIVHGNVIQQTASNGRTEQALSESEQLTAYLERVKSENNLLRLGGISSQASDPQRRLAEIKNPGTLAEVFIPLRIDRYRDKPERPDILLQSGSESSIIELKERQLTAVEGLSSQNVPRVVLLGEPGAGKSSVLRYLAYRMAEAYLQPRLLKDTLPDWQAGPLLPVFVPLARLADALPERTERGLDSRVIQFIADDIEASPDLRGFSGRLWRESRERGVLFLFDGLDEVAPSKRAVVKEAIAAFLSTRGCRAVVTCRTFSYGDEAWRLENWPAYQLAPLSREEQQVFVEKWYAALIRNDPPSQPAYAEKAGSLTAALFSNDVRQLQQIAANPLLLTLIAIVHTHREELPRSRVRIYEECVNLLLLRWQTRRQPGAPLQSVLEAMGAAAPDRAASLEGALMRGLFELAFEARKGQRTGLRYGETTLVDLHSLRNAMLPKLGPAATEVFVKYCESANGLLLAQGSRRLPEHPSDEEPVPCFAFPHTSFEEYLSARYVALLDHPQALLAQRNAASDRWFYVGVFLAEYFSIVSQRSRDVLDLVDELLTERPERPTGDDGYWRNVWLAGALWPIFRAEFPERCDTALAERLVAELVTLCDTGRLPPRERAQAARALAVLGDPRDLDELILIPAGPFWMGSDKERDAQAGGDELPQHEVDLPAFQIGKYPVTVGQWRRFAADTGYRGDPDALSGVDSEPVVNVSWADGREYCLWLTGVWRQAGKIGRDETVRLPSEAEWEKAARGTDRRIWPWGNTFEADRANTRESGLGATSAVGCFPTGASPYGCLDMAGNVWEWTRSRKTRYPYRADGGLEEPKGGKTFVLRGGAWASSQNLARCAYRIGDLPDYRYDFIGFRVVVVSPGSRR